MNLIPCIISSFASKNLFGRSSPGWCWQFSSSCCWLSACLRFVRPGSIDRFFRAVLQAWVSPRSIPASYRYGILGPSGAEWASPRSLAEWARSGRAPPPREPLRIGPSSPPPPALFLSMGPWQPYPASRPLRLRPRRYSLRRSPTHPPRSPPLPPPIRNHPRTRRIQTARSRLPRLRSPSRPPKYSLPWPRSMLPDQPEDL